MLLGFAATFHKLIDTEIPESESLNYIGSSWGVNKTTNVFLPTWVETPRVMSNFTTTLWGGGGAGGAGFTSWCRRLPKCVGDFTLSNSWGPYGHTAHSHLFLNKSPHTAVLWMIQRSHGP